MSNRHFWPLIALLILAPSLIFSRAFAVELTSTAAGFAGTTAFNCETDFNVFEIEILFNSAAGCRRHGIVEFDLAGTGYAAVSSATVILRDGGVGNMEGSLLRRRYG